jgi:DNA-binding PadR family transcriptional regulator
MYIKELHKLEDEKVALEWIKQVRKGYIRIVILTLLSKKPYHGYDIMKEVKERTEGQLRFTSGGIYRILQDLEKSKYVQGSWDDQRGRRKKIYIITEAGKSVLESALAKETELAKNMRDLFKEYLTGVLEVSMDPDHNPKTSGLFAMFLESRTGNSEDSIEVLKQKNAEIEVMIEKLQKLENATNRRLALLESKIKN